MAKNRNKKIGQIVWDILMKDLDKIEDQMDEDDDESNDNPPDKFFGPIGFNFNK